MAVTSPPAPVEPADPYKRVPFEGRRWPAPLFASRGARAMSLLDTIPTAAPSRSAPVLETERLVLRAPALADAPALAATINDRRIAEKLARVPHPYSLADAESFIAE